MSGGELGREGRLHGCAKVLGGHGGSLRRRPSRAATGSSPQARNKSYAKSWPQQWFWSFHQNSEESWKGTGGDMSGLYVERQVWMQMMAEVQNTLESYGSSGAGCTVQVPVSSPFALRHIAPHTLFLPVCCHYFLLSRTKSIHQIPLKLAICSACSFLVHIVTLMRFAISCALSLS